MIRVLYVTPDALVGDRLGTRFESDRSAVTLSYVTSVEQAAAALDVGRIDHVVVESRVADRVEGELTDTLTRGNADVRIHIAPEIGPPASDASGNQVRRAEAERIEALVESIESVVATETASGDGDEIESGRGGTELSSDGGIEIRYFRALAETLSDVILVIDGDSVIQFANPAAEDLFGYGSEELVGDSLTKLMSPELAEQHRSGVENYLRTGERRLDWNYIELTARHRDGHDIPIAVSFSEFTVDGERRFTGIVRDISDRKRREAELQSRVEQQDALATFSRHALEDRPLAELMDEAADVVCDVLDHEYSGVMELLPDEGGFVVRAVSGWPDEIVDSGTLATDRDSQAGYTLLTEQPVVSENLATEDRFTWDVIVESDPVKSGISIIIGSPERPWGVLGVHDTEQRSYTDLDVQFVQSIGRLLTAAIRRKEDERELERYETMLNAVGDGVYALDADSRFVATNDAYLEMTGYSREELLGEHVSKAVGEELYEESKWVQDAIESGESLVTLEATVPTADGGSIPAEFRVAPLHSGDVTGRVGVVRDVSDRKRREEKLTSLNEMLESLADAESSTEICELGVDAAIETLGFPNAAIALYDDEANRLVSTVRRWVGGDIDDALLGSQASDVAWHTFVEGESRVFDDLQTALDTEMQVSSAITVPLGKYGVFLAAAPRRDAFDTTDQSLADMLCSNIKSALGRAEREETLRDRRNELAEKNRQLERVDRLNRVIREITKALMRASSQEDVIQAVCDRLTETGPYRFAWFGDYDRGTDEVRPQASAGVEEGYLEEILASVDGEGNPDWGPAGRAVRTGELSAQNDLLGDPPYDPWREEALKRGYRSSVAIPVIYEETLRGVLNLYAEEPGSFNDTETEVLGELGEFIGYALNALEQQLALVSEQSVELDFRIRGTQSPVLALVAETDAEFEFENVVQRADGTLHAFFAIRNVQPEEAFEFVEADPSIQDVRLVTERDEEFLYECTVNEQSFLRSLVDRGAIPRILTAQNGEGRFVIRVPRNADVRTFMDLFEENYERVDLVARREVDEPVMTRQEFKAELADQLTERQEEVLRMAFFGGFFEWPRESTAEEIAGSLGVSQPTVSRHIRGAERVLFGLLFEE